MTKEFNWNEYRAVELQGRFLASMIGGMLLSGLGFMLPWFTADDGDDIFGGWHLLRYESDYTLLIVVALALYGLLFFIGLSRRFYILHAILAAMIVFVTTSVIFIAVANTAAHAAVNRDAPLTIGFGLLLVFLGHALMLITAIINAVLNTLRELL